MRKKLNGCKCSAAGCDRKATGWQDDTPYCNKHWLRIYMNGDTKLHGKKIKTKYIKLEKYAEGVTSKGIYKVGNVISRFGSPFFSCS